MIGESHLKRQSEPPAQGANRESSTRARREIASSELFGESREIQICHEGETYTLRRTSKGKLILTK